jgi:hypothetical protein
MSFFSSSGEPTSLVRRVFSKGVSSSRSNSCANVMYLACLNSWLRMSNYRECTIYDFLRTGSVCLKFIKSVLVDPIAIRLKARVVVAKKS